MERFAHLGFIEVLHPIAYNEFRLWAYEAQAAFKCDNLQVYADLKQEREECRQILLSLGAKESLLKEIEARCRLAASVGAEDVRNELISHYRRVHNL